MAKKATDRLIYVTEAVNDLVGGLNGKPFEWGDSERRAKELILAQLGYAVVTKTKLERGGHQLKRGVKPVGTAYFGKPIRRKAELYVLDIQTARARKFYDLLSRGKALLEGTHQFRRQEYGLKPLWDQPTVDRLKAKIDALDVFARDVLDTLRGEWSVTPEYDAQYREIMGKDPR